MNAPDIVATQFADLAIEASKLLAKVQAVTPAEAKATYAEFFKSEAEVYAVRANVCRHTADAMQSVADAMRGKLGEVEA